MTRLDATSEPSMEDILASIRKIIAEDPPGSRAAPAMAAPYAQASAQPQPNTLSSPSQLRGAGRDTFFPAASRPEAASAPAAPSPEPYLRAEPEKPSPASLDADAFFSRSTAKPFLPEAPSSRIEPSFAAMSQPATAPAALSVDAQLSDLLGDVLPEETASGTFAESSNMPAADVPGRSFDFADIMPGRASSQPIAERAPIAEDRREPRAGFTVSRDGFLPRQVAAEPVAERDPFDFDLGPSPFEPKPSSSLTASASLFDLGGVVPERASKSETPSTAAIEQDVGAPQSAAQTSEPIGPSVSDVAHEEPDASVFDSASVSIAAPSVAATIAPEAQAAALSQRASEPVARFVPANAGIDAVKSIERDVMEVVPREGSADDQVEDYRSLTGAVTETVSASAGVPMTQVHAHQRTMEDTVADLLRPMLKTWLAENMPRIVERALRREINEQLHGDKKAAAE